MKRLFFCIPFIALLSSCTSPISIGNNPPDLDICFSAEADITYGKSECTAQIKRIDKDNWEFCLTSPFALEGLVISIKDGVTTMSMYDMESITDVSENAVTIAKLISGAFESAVSETSPITEKDGVFSLCGQSSDCAYTLCFDGNNSPTALALDSRNVRADITKFVQLEKDETAEEADAEIIE